MKKNRKFNIDNIMKHYLVCGLWSSDLDNFGLEDILPSSINKTKKEIESFLNKSKNLLTLDWEEETIGHDFWLTRNGHGAGFWDRDLPNGDELTKIAKEFGTANMIELDMGGIEII